MKVLVCGDREWADEDTMARRLLKLDLNALVIHGGQRGADRMAGRIWASMWGDDQVCAVEADWVRLGKAAGPIRNDAMLAMNPDLVLAFHSDLGRSRGTADTVRKARKLGIPVEVIPSSSHP